MHGEPVFGRPADAALLLRGHGLERIAVEGATFLLHLDEPELPPAPHDQVELVASGPHVRAENAPPAQAIPPRRAALSPIQLGRPHR